MKAVGVIIRGLGWLWLALAALVIVASYAFMWYQHGWSEVAETMSPWNPLNLIVTLIVLAPGYGLVKLGERLLDRAAWTEIEAKANSVP